jgi:MinD superfamily P-loop ATPase
LLCPNLAITEIDHHIGSILIGDCDSNIVISGYLDPKEESGVEIIKTILNKSKKWPDKDLFIDCPPGSGCAVMESISEADYCLLVAESSIFGLKNLEMVIALAKAMHKPCGVILNKDFGNDQLIYDHCLKNGITYLGGIPFSRELAKINSEAKIASVEAICYRNMFEKLYSSIITEVKK